MIDLCNDDKNLWVGWDEYYWLIELFVFQVYVLGWKFDQILCFVCGGLCVGDQLLCIYDVLFVIFVMSLYWEVVGIEQGEFDIVQYIMMMCGNLVGNVLLVDDFVDFGVMFVCVQEYLKECYLFVMVVCLVVFWYKGCLKVKFDYYMQFLLMNLWIYQLFEEWDMVCLYNFEVWIKCGCVQCDGLGV